MQTVWTISYATPLHRCFYGQFDLTRILRVIRPVENGIAFQRNGDVEDYVLSRYQMYAGLFPPSHAMEVLQKSSQTC